MSAYRNPAAYADFQYEKREAILNFKKPGIRRLT